MLVMLSNFDAGGDAQRALELGAFAWLCEPFPPEELVLTVQRALEQRRLETENRRLLAAIGQRFQLGSIVSREPALQRILQTVESLSDTRATILIQGESGTGKSLLARTIHELSSRRSGPFIEVNCGALPSGLLESELFGHARGAFTGALRDRPGKFEAADGGTIFLDEIGVAPPDLQVKLLRVLQEKSFERLGETKTRTVDVRVLAATNSDLEAAVREGGFREDLYWRLNVVGLRLPPLRERAADVPLLAQHFLERFAREHGRLQRPLSPAALEQLLAHAWPGNVRELEHALERAVLLASGESIEAADLGPGLGGGAAALTRTGAPPGPEPASLLPLRLGLPLRKALEEPEREIIRRTLELNHGSRQDTARMLELNRATLFNKMRKYDLLSFPRSRD
ncbi:MAG: sigma-54-dependent Fis family transcriptional regulator [Planctomycetes bacterium]|nr:sigma-54-dependent Fis family transcriptional regulator [Planctomycetota bacterium]